MVKEESLSGSGLPIPPSSFWRGDSTRNSWRHFQTLSYWIHNIFYCGWHICDEIRSEAVNTCTLTPSLPINNSSLCCLHHEVSLSGLFYTDWFHFLKCLLGTLLTSRTWIRAKLLSGDGWDCNNFYLCRLGSNESVKMWIMSSKLWCPTALNSHTYNYFIHGFEQHTQ